MTSAEAVDIVRGIFLSGESNMELVSEELVDLTLNKGSRDNISAVVMRLPGAKMGDANEGIYIYIIYMYVIIYVNYIIYIYNFFVKDIYK